VWTATPNCHINFLKTTQSERSCPIGSLHKKPGGLSGFLRAAVPALGLGLFCVLTSTRAGAHPDSAMIAPGVFEDTAINGVSATTTMPSERIAQLKPIPPWKPQPPAKTPRKAKTPRQAKTPRPTKPIRQAKQPASPDIPLWEKCRYYLQPEERGSEAVKLACKKPGYRTPYWARKF
jgi:hypothetical protein